MKDAAIVFLGITCIAFAIIGVAKAAELREAKQIIQAYELMAEMTIKQTDQLKDIIRRCGAELCVDKDGNYDAIIPMTPEEFERFKDELRKRKQHLTTPTGEPT